MQIKTTMRYFLTPVRMAVINKLSNKDEDVEERETSCTVGMQVGADTGKHDESSSKI